MVEAIELRDVARIRKLIG